MAEIQPTFTNEQLVEIFDAFLSGNNDKIKVATQYLRIFIKKLESLIPLLNILTTSQNPGHRQLSAVLLKRNISSLYVEMEQNDKTYLKNVLLERYFSEVNSNTRKSIGVAVGDIARLALPQGEWNELLVVIAQKTNAQESEKSKESGLRLLSLVIDCAGENLEKHFVELHSFFKIALQDNNLNVKVEAYKCVLYMLETVYEESHVALYQDLIEPVLAILLQLVKLQAHEEAIFLGFDLIMNILEGSSTLLDQFLPDLVQYVLSENFLLKKALDVNIKECGLDLLGVVAEYRKSILTKNPQVLERFIQVLFTLIIENNSNQETGEEGLQDVVLFLIEDVAIFLPKRKIYKSLFDNIKMLFSSGNDIHKVIGFNVLAKISEGCAEHVKKDLANPIINTYIQDGLASQNSKVRAACVIAIAYFSQFLMPDILLFHQIIIPALLNNLGSLEPDLTFKALFCIDVFVNNLESDVVQYLQIIIPQLLNILESNQTTLQYILFNYI